MKKKIKKNMPSFRKTSLPPELVTKKKAGRGVNKEKHRQEHEDQVEKDGSRNPDGKEDFDKVLKAFLEDERES